MGSQAQPSVIWARRGPRGKGRIAAKAAVTPGHTAVTAGRAGTHGNNSQNSPGRDRSTVQLHHFCG